MADAFILDFVRTPIGKAGGALAEVRPDDLAAAVIAELVSRTGLAPEGLGDVYLGCANQAGEDNRNVARMAGLLAGLPLETPGVTVNRLCASGLEAVNQASRALRLGDGDLFIAGGVESMTRAPWVVPKPTRGWARGELAGVDTALGWRLINPRMPEEHTVSLGVTAENVAERYGVTREDQDEFALRSHRLAVAARDSGILAEEIIAVTVPARRGEARAVEHDEGPRADASLEHLAALRPAFREGGSVTAGNASPLSDGAAALLLGSRESADRLELDPLARIVSVGEAGVAPNLMGMGPVPACRKALDRAGLDVADIELLEVNEAFAAQAIASARELGFDLDKVNVNGGALAVGHPLGCSGARLLGTLACELGRRGARFGIATLCIGVGQGLATIIENPSAA